MVRRYLSNRDRILLHLSNYVGELNYYNAPFALTQEGIAEAIGIGRNNVPREMKVLIENGLVDSKKARVNGLKNRRTVYFLTQQGVMRVKNIRENLENKIVKVQDPSGKVEVMSLKEVTKRYGVDFITLAINLNKSGEINLLSIVRKRGKKIHYIDEDYVISRFYGRREELNEIDSFIKGDKKILQITGPTGIGKTTLMLKYVKERLKNRDVFFVRIEEGYSINDLLFKLAHFLSKIGHPNLEKYLRSKVSSLEGEINVRDVALIIKDFIDDEIYIFDNVENASSDLVSTLKQILGKLDFKKRFKIVFISTGIKEFVPISMMEHVSNLFVGDLKEEDAYAMLRDLGVPEDMAFKMINKYGGYPLILTLAKSYDSRMIRKVIYEGFFVHLEEKERFAVEFLSVFRKPVKISALLLNDIDYTTIYSLITKNIFLEMEYEVVTLHRMVRNFIYERLTPSKRKEYHKMAAQYFTEEGDTLEAIHHFINAGNLLRANMMLTEYYERFLLERTGQIRKLALNILNAYDQSTDDHEWLLYGIIGDTYFVEGKWEEALENYERAEEIARRRDADYMLKMCVKIAEIYAKRGKLAEAEYKLLGALEGREGNLDKRVLSRAYYVLGNIYALMNEYISAEDYLSRAQKIADMVGDYRLLGYAYLGLGILHRRMENNEYALEMFEKAIDFFDSMGDRGGTVKALINESLVYYDLSQMDKAIQSINRALKIAEHGISKWDEMHIHTKLGMYNIYSNNIRLAEKHLRIAERIAKELDAKQTLAYIYIAMGDLEYMKNNGKSAKRYYNMAIDIGMDLGDEKPILDATKEAETYLEKLGDDTKEYRKIREITSLHRQEDADLQ